MGRLGLLVGVLVLASACGEGEISDVPGGSRLGPEASGDGEMCSSGTCIDAPAIDAPAIDAPAIDAPATSSNWWGIVTKPDATNTGPNCSAPDCPSATLSAGNAPPSNVTQNGATYENFTYSGDTIAIKAANVTFRNFLITGAGAGGGTGVEVLSGGSNFLMEYGEMVGGGGCGQLMDGNGYTARYTQFHQCDDIIKINNGTDGNRGPVLVENSYWYDAGGGHGDTIQIWDETDSDITFRHNHLIAGETSVVIDWAINAPAGLLFEENWVHGVGGYYAIYCSSDGGGERLYQNNLFDRNWAGSVAVDAGCTWINNSYMDNFAPVPRN